MGCEWRRGTFGSRGLFWILQGTGIVPVGFMANHIQYAYEGIVVVLVGGGLIWFANRPKSKSAGQ